MVTHTIVPNQIGILQKEKKEMDIIQATRAQVMALSTVSIYR